jgi:hypothetical protein
MISGCSQGDSYVMMAYVQPQLQISLSEVNFSDDEYLSKYTKT